MKESTYIEKEPGDQETCLFLVDKDLHQKNLFLLLFTVPPKSCVFCAVNMLKICIWTGGLFFKYLVLCFYRKYKVTI